MEALISLEDEFKKLAGHLKVLGDPNGTSAYLYVRSSSKLQAMEGKESLSRQLLFGHERATEDGMYIPLDMVYWDIWRGKDADRPEFLRLLFDVKENKRSEIIYIDQTDRLSRNTAIYYVLLHDLTRYGLTVRFGSDEDELVRHIKLAFDEIELERKSYRQVQANKARATKGYLTVKFASFGYDLTADKRSYVINDEQACWVRKIFDWYTAGMPLRMIARTLTNQGVSTPRGARKGWDPSTINKMLANPVYKGTFIANRRTTAWVWEGGKQRFVNGVKDESEWIHVTVPALVSEGQWDDAQRRLAENKRLSMRNGRKHEWLLSKMVRCVCGNYFCPFRYQHTVQSNSGASRKVENAIYRCSATQRIGPEVCTSKSLTQEKLESMILEAVEMLICKVELWDHILEHKDDQQERLRHHVAICQKQITEIDAQLKELLQLVLEQRTPSMRELFVDKQQELERRRADCEEQMIISQERLALIEATGNRREVVEELLAKLRQMGGLSALPFEERRRLLTLLVDEITLDSRAQWFEIRGEINDRFSYASGEVVLTSAQSSRFPGSPAGHRSGHTWHG
jgi:site-specific DNA recombinase